MPISTANGFRGLLVTLPFLGHLAVADLLISLLLPLSFLLPRWTYAASSKIAAGVWGNIQNIFEKSNGARIIHSRKGFEKAETGDAPLGESALVISNHVSWTDFYMLQSLALSMNPQMLPYQRYFAKSSLRFVPLLGWGLWALRMPLVSRRWADDQAEIQRVFRGPRERNEPIWLVMFSEGTRWTARKWEQAVAWARTKGKNEPGKYVLVPRSRGFIASIQGLRDGGVQCVIDVTIAYATNVSGSAKGSTGDSWKFMSAPDMWTSLSIPSLAEKYAFWIHSERFDIASLPRDENELSDWIEERWKAKGERLERLGKRIAAGESVQSLVL